MVECDFEDALTRAEVACAADLEKVLPFRMYRDANPGLPDCGVFNVGYLHTGDTQTFHATAYHWRANLELFCRDRTELQKTVMRILKRYPFNQSASELMETSNVLVFRVAPETKGIGEILRTDISTDRDAKPMLTYNCTVNFDVVFKAQF